MVVGSSPTRPKYKDLLETEMIAIGIPTVVDLKNFVDSEEPFIVTPTDIDFMVEKLALLIGQGINSCIHEKFIRQNLP